MSNENQVVEGELPDIDTNDTSDTPEAETNVAAEVTPSPVVAKKVVKKKPVAIKTIEPTSASVDETPAERDLGEPDFVSEPTPVVAKKARKAPVKKAAVVEVAPVETPAPARKAAKKATRKAAPK